MTENTTLNPFISAIGRNCDIADADGAAIFSICGMALRLRDLNKWEQGLPPWKENDPAVLLDWIDRKEQLWERVGGRKFVPLPLMGNTFDPFDTIAVNQALSPMGLFYGAGYAHSLKPTFFLARIRETMDLEGIPVRILGDELMRDLLTIPAFTQDDTILLRRSAAGLFLWDQMAYLKKSGQRFLNFALRQCGLPDAGPESRKIHFNTILAVQEQTFLHHEAGELTDTVFDRQTFREIVSRFPHTPVELLARTIKDLLADTGPRGTLRHIISTKNSAALAFYAAFQDGLFRPLFPQLRQAVEKFVSDRDWEGITRATEAGHATACRYTRNLVNMVVPTIDTGDPEAVSDAVNQKLVRPLPT